MNESTSTIAYAVDVPPSVTLPSLLAVAVMPQFVPFGFAQRFWRVSPYTVKPGTGVPAGACSATVTTPPASVEDGPAWTVSSTLMSVSSISASTPGALGSAKLTEKSRPAVACSVEPPVTVMRSE